jgi:hypothetical protein
MAIETVAIVKLPRAVFEALPRSEGTPPLGLLDDAALIPIAVPFGGDPQAVLDALWALLGDTFADHDDDRGLFVIPSVAKPRSSTYDAVIDEIGDAGEWIALDDEDDDTAQGEVVDEDDGVGPGADFLSMLGQITSALGPDTIQNLQRAMGSGDMRAFAQAQDQVAAQLATRGDLVAKLEGLMGAMPPGLMNMAMNTSPEDLMRQAQGQMPPDMLAALQREASKGPKR